MRGEYVIIGDWEGEGVSGTTPIRGKSEFDGGLGIVGRFGYQPYSFFRLETEFAYRNNDASDITTTNLNTGEVSLPPEDDGEEYGFRHIALMMNAYLDLPIDSGGIFIPYVGAGAGWMLQRDGSEADAFAYQFMVGNRSFINNEMSFDMEYRYFNTDDLFSDSPIGAYNPEAHTIGLGVNWHFN